LQRNAIVPTLLMFNHLQTDELVEELRRIREKTANEVEPTFNRLNR